MMSIQQEQRIGFGRAVERKGNTEGVPRISIGALTTRRGRGGVVSNNGKGIRFKWNEGKRKGGEEEERSCSGDEYALCI